MSFLAPFFLGLVALAGVPLLVHLLRRRITRRVEFPALRFLQQTQREHSRERTMRNRWLLLLRLLAVLALVAAVARPIARIGGAGHPPIAVAIVLDQSMSTGAVVDGQTVFSRLQQRAGDLIGELTPDDRAWLVTSGGQVVTGDAAALSLAVNEATVAEGRGDLTGALKRAFTLVAAGAPREPVVLLLTDGQRTAAGGATDSLIDASGIPVVVHAPDLALPPNRTVHSVTLSPARWVPNGRVSATLSAPDSSNWRVLIGDRTVARGTAAAASFTTPVTVDAGAQATETGWLTGRVELDADDFPGDNARFFAVLASAPPAVRVAPSAGPFVAAAVDALVADGRLRRDGTSASGASATSAVAVISATDIYDGPALRIAPENPLGLVAANRALELAGIPWRFGAAMRDTVQISNAAGLNASEFTLNGARVSLRYRLSRVSSPAVADTGQVLAVAGGAPWMVAGTSYVIVASPLTLSATAAPVQAGFVPWIRDVLGQSLGDGGAVINAAPDDTIPLPPGADGLELPDGTLQPVIGNRITVPGRSGVYLVRRGARQIGALVVNPEIEESEVDAWGAGVWQQRVAGTTVQVIDSPGSVNSAVFRRSGGRPITWPLILVAVIALAIEALVARGMWSPRAAPVRA